MLSDFFLLAFRNLKKRGLRTWLTMIGIFIGVSAVVALVSLAQGMQNAIAAQFSSVGSDKLIIQGVSAGFGPPGSNSAGVITKDDVKLVKSVIGVDIVGGRLRRNANVEFDGALKNTFLVTLPDDAEARNLVIKANNYKISAGRMLKSSDRNKVMLGVKFGEDFFDKPVVSGDKVLINGKKFQVVGILKKIGAGRDSQVVMNEDDARKLFGSDDEYSIIFAQIAKGYKPSVVADSVLRAFRKDRGQKKGFEDVTVQSSEELFKSVGTILSVIQVIVIGIASISLVVGGIGIMNTMYTSVLERTRDIGIMKAIGARNKDILMMFLIESGLLGAVGGLIGVVLGLSLSKLVEFGASVALGPGILQADVSVFLIAGAILFSFVLGAVSGILPAREASLKQPVEALGYD
ncbi:hypothetical protein B6U93_03470 [Candidatus Woesearchaeota archaeon ex4484_78]|nr:MAG: hypothetical protein B6U93_03470 [Candidatus Woesearchaeota archaeon ex4484_78]